MIILHRHARELRYCNRGLREWFSREGLDWADFVKNGIHVDVLRPHENAMIDRVIKQAEGEQRGRV